MHRSQRKTYYWRKETKGKQKREGGQDIERREEEKRARGIEDKKSEIFVLI